jgi:hypothetical protein
LSDELPVPTKDGVGRDKRGDFGEGASANGLAPDRKPATLGIGQAKSPAAELLPENPILLSEVFNDCILLMANPAGQGGNENLPGLEHRRHP